MRLVYAVLPSALPRDKRCKVARVISLAFERPFDAEKLLQYDKAVFCQEKGEVVGTAFVRDSPAYPLPTLECVCVSREIRRQGVARDIIRCVQSDLGYDALLLHINRQGNVHYAAARALYEDCGFCPTAEDETEVEMKWEREQQW